MNDRFRLFITVTTVATAVCFLTIGCAKDESASESVAPSVNVKVGTPSALPSNAPPVVGNQIKASQNAAQAMQAKAAKDGDAYTAARAKAQ